MTQEDRVVERTTAFETDFVPGRVVPDDPANFRSTIRAVHFDGIAVEVVRSAPARFIRGPRDVAATLRAGVALLVVGQGSFSGTAAGAPYRIVTGEVGVYDTSAELDLHWSEPARMMICTVAAKHLPPSTLEGPPLPAGALPRTALVNSTIAFVSALTADGAPTARSPQLVRALADLTVEILAEVRGVLAHQPGGAGLRHRIEAHVTAHLRDRMLTPGSIAAALGVSLRSVHHAFQDDEMTVARLIRDRRLEAVATDLRDRSAPVALAGLAARYGFSSRDQLARSFRHRFGSTMLEYREQAPVEGGTHA